MGWWWKWKWKWWQAQACEDQKEKALSTHFGKWGSEHTYTINLEYIHQIPKLSECEDSEIAGVGWQYPGYFTQQEGLEQCLEGRIMLSKEASFL